MTGIVEDKEKICWRVTRHCNLRCVHCLAGHANQLRRDLTAEEQQKGLDTVIRSGVRRITWTGGEPTLCKNLSQLLRICHRHKVESIITTHGLALQEKLLDILDRQIDSLRFSFDGLEETHNAIRRGPFYVKSLSAMSRCFGLGLNVEANVTILAKNVAEIPELLRVLAANGTRRIVLMTLMYRESAVDNRVLGPSLIQMARLGTAIEVFERNNPSVNIQVNNYSELKDAYVVVESDGEILLCSEHSRDLGFGNILDSQGEFNLRSALDSQTLAHRQITLIA